MPSDKEIVEAVLSKVYMVLNAGDTVQDTGTVIRIGQQPTFVSFCVPAIPAPDQSFSFRFNTTRDQIEAASDYAYLANQIPPATGFWGVGGQSADEENESGHVPWRASGALIWDEYKRVLDGAELAAPRLTDEEKARLERAQKVLYTEGETIDPDTLETRTAMIETPIHAAVLKLQQEYDSALLAYNGVMINAQTNPDNPQVLATWNINGPIYRSRVRNAYNRMVASGGRAVQTAYAIIDQLSGRDPALIFAEARNRLELSRRTDLNGNEYHFSSFYPGSFLPSSQGGWTEFDISSSELHRIQTSTRTSWGGGASAGFGLWRIGGSAAGGSSVETFDCNAENFSLSMQLTRLPIRRSWFSPGILTNGDWKSPESPRIMLSDGGNPPHGSMVAYPTEIYLARNVEVGMDMTTEHNRRASSHFSSSASIGWGPFRLRGHYSRSTSSERHDFTFNSGGFKIPDPQIIGFGNVLLPKTPKD